MPKKRRIRHQDPRTSPREKGKVKEMMREVLDIQNKSRQKNNKPTPTIRYLENTTDLPLKESRHTPLPNIPKNLNFLQMVILLLSMASRSRGDDSNDLGDEKSLSQYDFLNNERYEYYPIQYQGFEKDSLGDSPSSSPNRPPKLEMEEADYVFPPKVTSSYLINFKDGPRYVKPTNGKIAQQNDVFMKEIGLNTDLENLELILAKTLTNSGKIVYTIGHSRKPMDKNYKNIYESPYFQKLMEKNKITDKDGTLKEATKMNKMTFSKLSLIGIADISNNGYNIFVNDKGEFLFPDTDIFSNSTFPDIEIIESLNNEEYQELRKFVISKQYQQISKQRLGLIQENSEPDDNLYDIFEKGFKKIKEIFEKNKSIDDFKEDTSNNQDEYEELGLFDDYVQNKDTSSIEVNEDGNIKFKFEGNEEDSYAPNSKAKRHIFFSDATTNKESLRNTRSISERNDKQR